MKPRPQLYVSPPGGSTQTGAGVSPPWRWPRWGARVGAVLVGGLGGADVREVSPEGPRCVELTSVPFGLEVDTLSSKAFVSAPFFPPCPGVVSSASLGA